MTDPVIGLRIRQWHKWQASIIRAVIKKRTDSGIPLAEPYAMGKVVQTAILDHDFLAFQAACGEPMADGFFGRVLRYCASNGALTGEILVQKEHFGRVVLSTPWDAVDDDVGAGVYDALVSSQIASTITVKGVGKGYRLAKKLALSKKKPAKNQGETREKPAKPRAHDSGSGSGSGSGSSSPQPPGGGRVDTPPPEPRKRRSKAAEAFDGLDIDTKRKVNIAWADYHVRRRSFDQAHPVARSIRQWASDRREYTDRLVLSDFDKIRAAKPEELATVSRSIIRRARDDKRNLSGDGKVQEIITGLSKSMTADPHAARIAGLEEKCARLVDEGRHDDALLLRAEINRLTEGNGHDA